MTVKSPCRCGSAVRGVPALASKRSAVASAQPYCGRIEPDSETTLQVFTSPRGSIANAMTWPPSNVSPGCRSPASGCPPSLNRRSKVIRVYWSFAPGDVACAAWLPITSQDWAASGLRLDSKWQDCGLPSPEIVTVTFSHHGELGSNVTAE